MIPAKSTNNNVSIQIRLLFLWPSEVSFHFFFQCQKDIQWKPLNVITLGPRKTDNNNRILLFRLFVLFLL
jgi:hypothetical protein